MNTHRGFEPEDLDRLQSASSWLHGLADNDCNCEGDAAERRLNPCCVCHDPATGGRGQQSPRRIRPFLRLRSPRLATGRDGCRHGHSVAWHELRRGFHSGRGKPDQARASPPARVLLSLPAVLVE